LILEDYRNIDIERDLLSTLEQKGDFNSNYWAIVKRLIFIQIQNYFELQGITGVSPNQNIYDNRFFGSNIKIKCNELLETQVFISLEKYTRISV
jgi:hypothetical protein